MKTSEKITFDQWWAQQPIASQPDSSRVAYLRDMAQRVWISAQQAMMEPAFDSVTHTRWRTSPTTYTELVAQAGRIFFENTREELESYTFQQLYVAIEVEEDDRKHGVRPNYRIDDVVIDSEWR